MIAPGSGGIITVTSNGGVIGEPFPDAYCASKFALEGLMQPLAPIAAHFGGKEHHGLPDLSRVPEPPDRSSDGVSTAPGLRSCRSCAPMAHLGGRSKASVPLEAVHLASTCGPMSSRIWANRSGWRSGRACPASGTLTVRTLTWAQTARMAS